VITCAHPRASVIFINRPIDPWSAIAGQRSLQAGEFAHVVCECGEAYLGVPRHASAAGIPAWVTRTIAQAKRLAGVS